MRIHFSYQRFLATGFLLCALFGYSPPLARAQENNSSPNRERGIELYEAAKYVDAIPLLEEAAARNPTDIAVLSRLGFSLYATSTTLKDPAERSKMRERAKTLLLQSREFGDNSNLTNMALEALSSPASSDIPFSQIKAAEKAMQEGEEAFVRGQVDQALILYKRALELDPKLYEAALFAGDMYFKKGHVEKNSELKNELMGKAGEWFAQAIAINQNRETAHRYWGDALMAQGKMNEASLKFIEAIIAEPFNKSSYVGLTQWAERNQVGLAHPQIQQPASAARAQTPNDPTPVLTDQDKIKPESGAAYFWSLYDRTRATWGDANFAKEYPQEKKYRHSLKEEAAALHMVAEASARQLKEKKIESLDPSLTWLVKLHESDLIEAYVLFARMNQEIIRDYADYRQQHRDKLRQYWSQHVIKWPR